MSLVIPHNPSMGNGLSMCKPVPPRQWILSVIKSSIVCLQDEESFEYSFGKLKKIKMVGRTLATKYTNQEDCL